VTLEWAAEEVDGVRPGSAAAFSCFDTELGTEAPVLACEVAEKESDWSRGAILRQVEESVLRQTSLRPREVVLLAPGSIPKTTSGKIQRGRARELYMAGLLGRTP
jgi:fatty-acyl-CoA synthase